MGPTCYPETSAINYPYSQRNNIEERSSHLLRGGSRKSRILLYPVCFAGKITVGKLRTCESQGIFRITEEILQIHGKLLSCETHKSVTAI